MRLSWHSSAWRQHFTSGQAIPQSLLLCGSAGAGLDEFGDSVAQAAVCSHRRADGEACGECLDCQWAEGRRHPDLLWLGRSVDTQEPGEGEGTGAEEPSGDTGKGTTKTLISVAEVRDLITFFQLTPHRERARVAVLNPAESMNLAAANALLKVLEEPPPRAHLILVSRTPARLPATIRSRCRTLRLPRPDAATARAWLENEGVESPDLALAQAGGAPLAARNLPTAYWETRAQLLPSLAEGAECTLAAIEAEVAHVVALMQSWCFDLASVRCGGAPRYHPDYTSALARLAPKVPAGGLRKLETRLRDSRRLVDHPMNPKLAIEALLIAYARAFKET